MSKRRGQEEAKAENHERWIVSYADMVTLLFALFVVLYAMGDSNPDKIERVRTSINRAFDIGVLTSTDGASPIFDGGGGLAPSLDEIRSTSMTNIRESLRPFTENASLGSKIQVRSDATNITVSLADDLLFASGSADLRPGSQEVLLALAATLNALPNNIRVEGHTDNVPTNSADHETNWELSSARANRVLRFLQEEGGLSSTRLSAASFAETRPIGDNDTPEGRALNRRADIVVLFPSAADLAELFAPSQPETD